MIFFCDRCGKPYRATMITTPCCGPCAAFEERSVPLSLPAMMAAVKRVQPTWWAGD